MTSLPFDTRPTPEDVDAIAPDGSEIRLLCNTKRGSMAHGTLPPGGISLAIQHRTVDEIWYVVSGAAELWRQFGNYVLYEVVVAGYSLSIPRGVAFQFRTVGQEPFGFIMCTMPPWPGEQEAIPVAGPWEATRDR